MSATAAAAMVGNHQKRWCRNAIKQVTKSNFASTLQHFKSHVKDADFIAISTKKTGHCAASLRPWRRILSFDTSEIAYLKAKHAAESYQLLHFTVCPFRVLNGSKIQAFPYNFHLFPRDEQNLGMPSYTFACQTSFMTSLAEEGFDFNACIYDGISYLSRVQESIAKNRNPIPQMQTVSSSLSSLSVADSVFISRIKSKVEKWRNACKDSSNKKDDSIVKSLRELVLGGGQYGSRSSITIDVCSHRQVQLALQAINKISDDLVTLVVLDKAGEPNLVRVVLTSSEEDKNLLLDDIQILEEEQNLKVRGFREVIDVIASSYKPIVGYNCLHEFTFIHSKFIAPLPTSLGEFMCSLRMVFSNILDLNCLMKKIGPLKKAKNHPSALSYLKRQFFVPTEFEFPLQDECNGDHDHGHSVLRNVQLFAKLTHLLSDSHTDHRENCIAIENFSNIFYPVSTSLNDLSDDDFSWMDDAMKVTSDSLIFLWGFSHFSSAKELKESLQEVHFVFKENFELQVVDKTCVAVVFSKSGYAEAFLEEIKSGNIHSDVFSKLISEGLKVAGYEAYRKVCMLGIWDADLADSLDIVLSQLTDSPSTSPGKDALEIYWSNDSKINLNDL